MNDAEALKTLQNYYDLSNPGEDDEFVFTEALKYIIEDTKNPKYMTELGSDDYGEHAIGYNGKWYRCFEDFCQRAETGNEKFTSIYDEFYDVEVA